MNKKKKLKTIGIAKQCVDCEAYIDSNTRMTFESYRKNPEYKLDMPLHELFKPYPQCDRCNGKF